MNVQFKSPTGDYMEMFDQMVESGAISTRGLKADAEKFGELVFDVNSAYFYNHGGYDFAKKFYTDVIGCTWLAFSLASLPRFETVLSMICR